MSHTVAEVIVDAIINAGAKRCYGIVGDTINQFTDALRKSDLKWVHVRHEEVGALAAGGEAYMTGELAVCAGTCGPGSLHFINGIFESHRNGAPVLLIASNVARSEEGFNFPQEVDQQQIYAQCSVFCERISHPDQARRIVAKAAQAALTKGGVAVVVVNGDMFREKTGDNIAWQVTRPAPVILPNENELDLLAGKIAQAGKICIYAGLGARDAQSDIIQLAQLLKAPVAHTSRAKEFIEPNNPFNVGMTGILGNKAGFEAVSNCDLMLCLGTDFAYPQFYPSDAEIIQVDTKAENIGRRHPVSLGLVGDVSSTIKALLPKLEARRDDRFLNKALHQWQEDWDTYEKRAESQEDLIHPQSLTLLLNKLAADNAIFTADGGSPMVWLLRHLQARGERRFLTSLAHGTMANAYPQALGIALAYPHRQVIALCGDGGMTMLMGDLLTLVQEKVPVKLVIYNNSSLGFVEMEQRVEGLLDTYTELQNPNFAKLAEACNIPGWQVTETSQLEAAMTAWLAAEGPAVLDVKVNRVELVMPPEIKPSQVASTAMFGLKAIIHGRAGEVYSLLKDNFVK